MQVTVVQLDTGCALGLLDVFETVVETVFDICVLDLAWLTQEQVVTSVATEVSVLLQVGLFAMGAEVSEAFLSHGCQLLLF